MKKKIHSKMNTALFSRRTEQYLLKLMASKIWEQKLRKKQKHLQICYECVNKTQVVYVQQLKSFAGIEVFKAIEVKKIWSIFPSKPRCNGC